MHDIKVQLGVKDMSDLATKELKAFIIKNEIILRYKKKKIIKHGLIMDLCTFLVILL